MWRGLFWTRINTTGRRQLEAVQNVQLDFGEAWLGNQGATVANATLDTTCDMQHATFRIIAVAGMEKARPFVTSAWRCRLGHPLYIEV